MGVVALNFVIALILWVIGTVMKKEAHHKKEVSICDALKVIQQRLDKIENNIWNNKRR